MPAYGDLVHQVSTTIGTGNQTLAAVNGKRTFLSAFGTGGSNVFDYYISHREQPQWERGTGHESGGALVRDTVIASSNANALVSFSAGVKDITNDQPAGLRINKTGDTFTGPVTLAGSAAPQLMFSPSSGATKTGQIYQQGDILNFASAGVGVWGYFNLGDGSFNMPSANIVLGNDNTNSNLLIGGFGHKIGRRGSDGSAVIGGGQASIIFDPNPVAIQSTVASTSTTTGALTVGGGVGIAGALNVGTTINGIYITSGGGYGTISAPSGAAPVQMILGGGGDAYWRGTTLYVQSQNGATSFANFQATGLTVYGTANWTGSGSIAFGGVGAGLYYSTDTVTNRFFLGTDGAGDTFRLYATGAGQILTVGGATGNFAINTGTASTSQATGALVVAGGVGIGGALYAGPAKFTAGVGQMPLWAIGPAGQIHIDYNGGGSSYLDQSTLFIRCPLGGAAVVTVDAAKLAVLHTTASTSTTTGALTVAGGLGVAGVIFASGPVAVGSGIATGLYADGGNVAIRTYAGTAKIFFQTASGAAALGDWDTTRLAISPGTASTTTGTGALVVSGGVGIAGAVYAGGLVSAASYNIGSATFAQRSGNYTSVLDNAGVAAFTIGNATDPTIYYNNTGHVFRNRANTVNFLTIDATKTAVLQTTACTSYSTGALTVGGGCGIAGALYTGGPIAITMNGAAMYINAQGGNANILWQLNANSYWTQVCAAGNGAMYFLDLDAAQGVGLGQDTTGWTAASDRRLKAKKNARTLEGLLDRLDKFRLVEYGRDHKKIGAIAQELTNFVPQLVTQGTDDDDREITNIMDPGCWSVLTAESGLVALQVAKEIWQRLSAEIAELKRTRGLA